MSTLPMTPQEISAHGWNGIDVLFVTGDAYIDHPGFAAGLLCRLIESLGFRVAILSQPDWRSCDDWRKYPKPRLAVLVSAGAMDSMLNHYTANRKIRSDDAFSPDGEAGRRPDRATAVYCQRSREAFGDVPIICGGIEASLRRFAHYDYWSDKVRRSVLLDAKADLLSYGMGERSTTEILQRLAAGESIRSLRDIRGTAYRLGAKEPRPTLTDTVPSAENPATTTAKNMKYFTSSPQNTNTSMETKSPTSLQMAFGENVTIEYLPTVADVTTSPEMFCEMTRRIQASLNPYINRVLIQECGEMVKKTAAVQKDESSDTVNSLAYSNGLNREDSNVETPKPVHSEAVVVNPPSLPLSAAELDAIYRLPYTRRPSATYGSRKIPAFEMIRDSVTVVRGCSGGCAFCGLGAHQGKILQSRNTEFVIEEVRQLAKDKSFKGTISDLGGPTANCYGLQCRQAAAMKRCERSSCLYPKRCPNLTTDPKAYLALLREARQVAGVKRVLIASGIRMDLASLHPEFVRELAEFCTGGHLKVAPEHVSDTVLRYMGKPPHTTYELFAQEFTEASQACGKSQYLVPYFIAGHPGCRLEDAITLAVYLKRHGLRPRQVQDFIPIPMTVAACMYHTGLDPRTDEAVDTAKSGRERAYQRALLQYFLPENDATVREALRVAGREDLIGTGRDALVPTFPPRTAADGRSGTNSGANRGVRRRSDTNRAEKKLPSGDDRRGQEKKNGDQRWSFSTKRVENKKKRSSR